MNSPKEHSFEDFVRQGRNLLDGRDPVHTHSEFLAWDLGVAEWLDTVFPGSGASADWGAQPMSMLVTGGHYYDDANVWAAFRNAVQARLTWLARFAAGAARQKTSMTEDELELKILQHFVDQHRRAGPDTSPHIKEAQELDMRDVLRELTGKIGDDLNYEADLWYTRLVVKPSPGVPVAPLRPGKSGGRYRARAFMIRGFGPAWDRIRELQRILADSRPALPERERDQKFRILWSHGQAVADFTQWTTGEGPEVPVAVLFVDIDDFKSLNIRFTELRVDEAVLRPFQVLLDRLTLHRGHAYRVGGDEFVILLPNHTPGEVMSFADRVREEVAAQVFDMGDTQEHVTVSIGVSLFPQHGRDYQTVAEAAARAKQQGAKEQGKNRVAAAS